jgi:dynein heavy chain 1
MQVWCAEFDRTDDDTRRDTLPLRDITNKRPGDKHSKEEKVCLHDFMMLNNILSVEFLEGHMTLKPIVHEIRIQNVIFLDPPNPDRVCAVDLD